MLAESSQWTWDTVEDFFKPLFPTWANLRVRFFPKWGSFVSPWQYQAAMLDDLSLQISLCVRLKLCTCSGQELGRFYPTALNWRSGTAFSATEACECAQKDKEMSNLYPVWRDGWATTTRRTWDDDRAKPPAEMEGWLGSTRTDQGERWGAQLRSRGALLWVFLAGGVYRLGFLSLSLTSCLPLAPSLDRERLQHGAVWEWLQGKPKCLTCIFFLLCCLPPRTTRLSLDSVNLVVSFSSISTFLPPLLCIAHFPSPSVFTPFVLVSCPHFLIFHSLPWCHYLVL